MSSIVLGYTAITIIVSSVDAKILKIQGGFKMFIPQKVIKVLYQEQ